MTLFATGTSVAAARELRDRWLEQVNVERQTLVAGKYDVTRAIDATIAIEVTTARSLPAGEATKRLIAA